MKSTARRSSLLGLLSFEKSRTIEVSKGVMIDLAALGTEQTCDIQDQVRAVGLVRSEVLLQFLDQSMGAVLKGLRVADPAARSDVDRDVQAL